MSRISETQEVAIVGYALQGAWVVTTDYFVDDAVTDTGETYVCIQDHTAAAADRPGVGVNWEDYWVLIDYVESDIFRFYPSFAGILHMPVGWTAADIGFLVSPTVDGTFSPLYDISGNLVVFSTPAVDTANVLPAELAGSVYVKLWSNTAGVNEAQGADRAFLLDLKC
jgi:hypothetical protein